MAYLDIPIKQSLGVEVLKMGINKGVVNAIKVLMWDGLSFFFINMFVMIMLS